VSAVRTLLAKLRGLLTRDASDAILGDEIALHLELLESELRGKGYLADEARRRARREFGSIGRVYESAREARGFWALE
jgi:hypothetical protein